MTQRFGFSLSAVFIASSRRSQSVLKPAKQNGWSGTNHGSIRDSWPIAFSGYPRGPRVVCETDGPRDTAPNFTAETRSRTRVSREPDGHRQRKSPGWSGFGRRHSSCLWFQMLGVERHSLLPHNQHDGGNLPGQGQTRHLWPHPLAQQARVKLLERTGLGRGDDRRALQQILQIVVAIFVQPANRCGPLGSLQLPFDIAVIGTAVGPNAKTAEGPQLSLGAKSMRRLQDAQQHGRPDRTDRRNLAEQFPRRVFLAFLQQLAPHFPTQGPQRVQLLIVKLCPATYPRLGDFRQPLRTMLRRIDLLTRTGNGPTAIDRLHP